MRFLIILSLIKLSLCESPYWLRPDGVYDCAVVDVVQPINGFNNGIIIRVFYPTDRKQTFTNPIFWTPEPKRKYYEGLARATGATPDQIPAVIDQLMKTWGVSRMPFEESSPIAQNSNRFPLIIFSHMFVGERWMHEMMCCSLAANGFIVAALEHRGGTAAYSYNVTLNGQVEDIFLSGTDPADGDYAGWQTVVNSRTVELIRAEIVMRNLSKFGRLPYETSESSRFDWMQFKNRLDEARSSLAGHSMGGTTVIQAAVCPLFKAALVFDGGAYQRDSVHTDFTDTSFVSLTDPTEIEKKWEQQRVNNQISADFFTKVYNLAGSAGPSGDQDTKGIDMTLDPCQNPNCPNTLCEL